MRGSTRTVAFFAVLVTLAAAVGLSVRQAPPDSQVPSVENAGPLGLRALYLYLREGGAPVEAHHAALDALPEGARTVVIPAPRARTVSTEEVRALEHFVREGGTLVYLAPREPGKQAPLEAWLDLREAPLLAANSTGLPEGVQDLGGASVGVWVQAGAARGLATLRVSRDRGIALSHPEAVPLAGSKGSAVLWRWGLDKGEVYVLAGTDLAENRRLELADNLRFWDALAARGPLYFDEFHHTTAEPPPLSRGIWAFALQCLAVGLLYVVSRGSRFGPPRPLGVERHRSALEYVRSMGWLARRSKVERELLPELSRHLRQQMQERLGVPATLPEVEAARVLEQTCGVPASEYLAAVEDLARTLERKAITPGDYARVARRYAHLERAVTGRAPYPTPPQ
ncbi:DUF4350 domain-containing protein [Myxococcaceae bacterium GXIMD 01537]